MVRPQVLSGEACYVLRCHGLDAGGDLLWRQELRACYYATADAIHPRSGALEGKERRALELLLGTLQLFFRDRLLHDPPELFDDHLDRLLHVARRGADVSLDRAGIRVPLVVGVHGVCETTLLAHLLKQAAAHTAPKDIVQGGHRITVFALRRNAQRAHRDVVLLRLLEPEEKATIGWCRMGLAHERHSPWKAGKLLLDLPFDVVLVELAGGDHEDVGSRVGATVEVL